MLSDAEARARLINEVQAGRCVAFVGAGFSAPVCRSWGALLEAIAGEVRDGRVRGAEQNREVALRLGALEYTSDWESLFEVMDRRFGPPP